MPEGGERGMTVDFSIRIKTTISEDLIELFGEDAANAAIRERLMDLEQTLCFIREHAGEVTLYQVTVNIGKSEPEDPAAGSVSPT